MGKKRNSANNFGALISGLASGYALGANIKDREARNAREEERFTREKKEWQEKDDADTSYAGLQKYDPKLEPYEDVQGPIDPNNPRKLTPQQEWDMRAKKVLEVERNLPIGQRARIAPGITDQKAQLMGSWMEQFKPEVIDANGAMSQADSVRHAIHTMTGKMKLGQPPTPQEQMALSKASETIEREGYGKAVDLFHQGRFSEGMKAFNNTGEWRGWEMVGSPQERYREGGGGAKIRSYDVTVRGPNGEERKINTYDEQLALAGVKVQMDEARRVTEADRQAAQDRRSANADARGARADARAEQEALRQEREHAIRMDRQVAVTTARERLRDARARGNKAEIAEAEQMVRDAGGDLSTPVDPKRTTHIDSTTGTAYIMEGGVPVGQIPVSEIPQFKRPGAAAAAAGTKEEKVDVAGGFAKTAASAADLLTGNARLLRPTQPEGVAAEGKVKKSFASEEAAAAARKAGKLKDGDPIMVAGKPAVWRDPK